MELQQKEQEGTQRLSILQQEIGRKESELENKEKQLHKVKNEVVQVGFEKTSKEAGKGILEGVGRLMGNPKAKKLEAEIGVLNSDIENLRAEKENAEKEAKVIIFQKEKEIEEKDRIINIQQTKLDKLFGGIPVLKEYDFIMGLCERIRIPFDIVKQIFSGKKVSYSGELYSPEHKQNFEVKEAVVSIAKDKENKPCLAIDGLYYVNWFREQKNMFLQNLGIKINEPKNQRGMKK